MTASGEFPRGFEVIVRWHELPLLAGLVLMWMALWHEVSLMSFVSGLLVSILAMRLFYLPPVELAGRINVWWTVRYLGYFLWHLIVASCQIAWLAVRPGTSPKTSIIALRLNTHSDFILTVVGLTMSLIPGSLVAEVDRFASTLYLHVLNTPTEADVERVKQQGFHIESLLIRAFGSRDELEALT